MPNNIIQLVSGLWVGQSRLFQTNHGIFLSEGEAFLVDPGIYPDEIENIARFVSEQSASVQSVVLTHSHWDHILGPERFPGVKITAQASYTAQAHEHDLLIKSILEWQEKAGLQRDRPFTIPLPDQTFGDSTALRVGSLLLRLTHAPGHAADQLTIYHEESGTLWAADMLSDLEIPFVSHNLIAYQRTLEKLAEWDIRALVPGHGHTTVDPQEIRTRISEDIEYLAELRSRVEAAVQRGKTLEEAVSECAEMTYRNPLDNAHPHSWNVESAYVELGGERGDAKVGWERETV